VDALRALNAREVIIALDADFRSNPHVAKGLALAVKVYREAGLTVCVETWDPSSAKGIDDALMAHATLTRHEGDAVDRVVNSAQPSHAKGKTTLSTGATERVNAAQASATGQGAPSGVSHGALSDSLTLRFERGDAVEIAHALIAELSAESIDHADCVVYDRGSFYVYDPGRGIYTERTQSELFQCVSRYAGSIVGPKDKPLSLSDRDIRGAIHAASQLVYRKDFFDSAPRGVVFSNGFVTVREGSVITLPHSPEHRAAHAIACEYAGAPTDDDIDLWLRTMREVFRRPIEDEKGNLTGIDELDTDKCMDLFQEFAGAALMGYATSYAACLVLQGPGNDGKSTLLHVLRALFPASAVSSIPPQSWSRGFLLAGLAGKRLNVVSELPSQDLMDSERFKAVVSGDALTAERKHQDPFTTAFEAGHLFACNELMNTRDQTRGFWRRFVVIPCVREFSADEVKRDHHKAIIANELSGVAAWAIEGAARLARQGAYTNPESAKQAKKDWQHESDQVRQWVDDCCVEMPKDAPATEKSTIDALYACYRAWGTATGHAGVARNKLAQRIKGLGYESRMKVARLYRLRLNERWEKIMSEHTQNGEKGLTYGRRNAYHAN
jgi:P4 family phage/plasmid primase-like protien